MDRARWIARVRELEHPLLTGVSQSVAKLPHRKQAVTISGDEQVDRYLRVWRLTDDANAVCLHSFPIFLLNAVAVSADGEVCVGLGNYAVNVWDVRQNWRLRASRAFDLGGMLGPFHNIMFSPDNRFCFALITFLHHMFCIDLRDPSDVVFRVLEAPTLIERKLAPTDALRFVEQCGGTHIPGRFPLRFTNYRQNEWCADPDFTLDSNAQHGVDTLCGHLAVGAPNYAADGSYDIVSVQCRVWMSGRQAHYECRYLRWHMESDGTVGPPIPLDIRADVRSKYPILLVWTPSGLYCFTTLFSTHIHVIDRWKLALGATGSAQCEWTKVQTLRCPAGGCRFTPHVLDRDHTMCRAAADEEHLFVHTREPRRFESGVNTVIMVFDLRSGMYVTKLEQLVTSTDGKWASFPSALRPEWHEGVLRVACNLKRCFIVEWSPLHPSAVAEYSRHCLPLSLADLILQYVEGEVIVTSSGYRVSCTVSCTRVIAPSPSSQTNVPRA